MALLPSFRPSVRRSLVAVTASCLRVAAIPSLMGVVVLPAAPSFADEAVTRVLNDLPPQLSDARTAWRGLFDAYLDMTPCPQEIGPGFGQVDIWPKMAGWESIADWAGSNKHVGQALKDAADKEGLGLPYGADEVSASYRNAGLMAQVHIDRGGDVEVAFPYLNAFQTFSAWAAAELYRRFEAGDYAEGFDVAIANARVLRMLCDRHMLEEKSAAMLMLCESMSVLRDAMFAYVDKIPADEFKRVATKELPFLKPADAENLKRLQMPEGDRFVIEAILDDIYAGGSTPDPQRLGEVFGEMQSSDKPLTRFGATKRWERIAGVHGSLEASKEKLNRVYDDWWRRWRIRSYDAIQQLPTEFSLLNEIRYAIIAESIADLQSLFDLRDRLIVEINGTVMGCALCGDRVEYGSWTRDREQVYAAYMPKRFDFDPFDKEYGRFLWTYLGDSSRSVDTDYGRIKVSGGVVYARGRDHEDSSFEEATLDGLTGDMIVWPPLRQLARDQGLIP